MLPRPSRRSSYAEPPVQLVTHDLETVRVVPEGLDYLRKIEKGPIKIVTILGEYRSGKSYLLSRLMDRPHGSAGFKLGHTVIGETQGVWVCAVPPNDGEEHHTLFVDVEGLADPDGKTKSPEMDGKMALLAALLGSCLILNVVGVPNTHHLQNLAALARMAEVLEKGGSGSKDVLRRIFPPLYLVIRDHHLNFATPEKRTCTAEEYLDWLVTAKDKDSDSVRNVKNAIVKAFPKDARRIFTMPLPLPKERLSELDYLENSEVNPKFNEALEKIATKVKDEVNIKAVLPEALTDKTVERGGREMVFDGAGLALFVDGLVEQINTAGDKLSLPDFFAAYEAQLEKQTLDGALATYTAEMSTLALPAVDEAFQAHHASALEEAQNVVKRSNLSGRSLEEVRKAVNDDILREQDGKRATYHRNNSEASKKVCDAALQDEVHKVQKAIDARFFGTKIKTEEALKEAVEAASARLAALVGPAVLETLQRFSDRVPSWTKQVKLKNEADIAAAEAAELAAKREADQKKHELEMAKLDKEAKEAAARAAEAEREAAKANAEAAAARDRANSYMSPYYGQAMGWGGMGGGDLGSLFGGGGGLGSLFGGGGGGGFLGPTRNDGMPDMRFSINKMLYG